MEQLKNPKKGGLIVVFEKKKKRTITSHFDTFLQSLCMNVSVSRK